MACYKEPSGKLSLEVVLGVVWKKSAGTFKKYLTGDLTNHLSITVYHGLTSTIQI